MAAWAVTAPVGALGVEAPVCAAPVFSLGRPARARTSSGGRKDGRIHGSCAGSPFWTIYRLVVEWTCESATPAQMERSPFSRHDPCLQATAFSACAPDRFRGWRNTAGGAPPPPGGFCFVFWV